LVAVPGVSLAQFNYSYVDLDYVFDVEFGSLDGDGFAIGGQFEVAETFFIGAGYEDYSLDFGVDSEILEVFGGYFHNLNEELDFVVTFGWVDLEVSSGNARADDDGLSLSGGVRYAINSDIEVDAMLEHVNYDEGGSDTGVALRGRYYFDEDFAVSAQLDLGKDIETFRIGIRYQF
jgi:opacity protein-like surface antigen